MGYTPAASWPQLEHYAGAAVMAAMKEALEQYHGQCVYLYTSQSSNQLITVAQRKVQTQLDGLKIGYASVDGMDTDKKEVRKAIWDMAGAKPGSYPIIVNMATGKCWQGDSLQMAMDNNELQTDLLSFIITD